MDRNLPVFRYHPDPVGTGMIVTSQDTCMCCGKARGFLYTGPVHGIGPDPKLCPWCIDDGSAHANFDVSFTDEAGIGGGGIWDDVPGAVVEAVAYRTTGFNGWQQEQWWTHCGDAGQFLDRAGRCELELHGPEAMTAIQDSTGLDGAKWDRFLAALDKDAGPTAYIFRCTKCGALGGYQDTH